MQICLGLDETCDARKGITVSALQCAAKHDKFIFRAGSELRTPHEKLRLCI